MSHHKDDQEMAPNAPDRPTAEGPHSVSARLSLEKSRQLNRLCEWMIAEGQRTGRVQTDDDITPEMEARFRAFMAEGSSDEH